MSYSYTTFIRPTSSDVNIKIYDISGDLSYTINPFSIINIQISNNLIKIYLKELDDILLDFDNPTESKMALQMLQSQLNILRQKNPLFIDDQIKNYVNNIGSIGATGLQGFQGFQGNDGVDGLQGFQGNDGIDGLQGPQGIISTQPDNQIIVGSSENGSISYDSNIYDGFTQVIKMKPGNGYNKSQSFTGIGIDDLSINIGSYNIDQGISYTTSIYSTFGSSPSIISLKLQYNTILNEGDSIYGPTISYIDGTGDTTQYYLYADPAMGQTIQPLQTGPLVSITAQFAIRSMTSDVFAKIYDSPNGNLLATCDSPVNAIWTGVEFATTNAFWTFNNINFTLVANTTYYVEFSSNDTTLFFGQSNPGSYTRGNFYHGNIGSVNIEPGFSLDFILVYGGRDAVSTTVITSSQGIDGYQYVICPQAGFVNSENVLINNELTGTIIQNIGEVDLYKINEYDNIYTSGSTFSTPDGLLIYLNSTIGHNLQDTWVTNFSISNIEALSILKNDGTKAMSIGDEININGLSYSFPNLNNINSYLFNDGQGSLSWKSIDIGEIVVYNGPGAGDNPLFGMVSTSEKILNLTIQTGISPQPSSNVAIIQLQTPYLYNLYPVISPANESAVISGVYANSSNKTDISINSTSGLSASTTYIFNILI